MAIGALIATLVVTYLSRTFLSEVGLFPGLLLLLLIVATGIVFDVIGTAAAAAETRPLHAMAADKVPGAYTAVRLLWHADRVANFSNDLVGDISATLSGAVGTALVFEISSRGVHASETLLSTLMVGLISALTVGGKAAEKRLAIDHATEIIFWVGKALHRVERLLGVTFFARRPSGRSANTARRKRGSRSATGSRRTHGRPAGKPVGSPAAETGPRKKRPAAPVYVVGTDPGGASLGPAGPGKEE